MLRIMMTHMAQDLSFDKIILHLYKRIEFMYLFASNKARGKELVDIVGSNIKSANP